CLQGVRHLQIPRSDSFISATRRVRQHCEPARFSLYSILVPGIKINMTKKCRPAPKGGGGHRTAIQTGTAPEAAATLGRKSVLHRPGTDPPSEGEHPDDSARSDGTGHPRTPRTDQDDGGAVV